MIYEVTDGRKYQNNYFHCTKLNFRSFWTRHFVKFESKCFLKLRKLHLLKEISYDICKVFLTLVSVDLLYKMTGLSLFWKTDSNFTTNTHTHTHTHTQINIVNVLTYLDRSWMDLQAVFCFPSWEKIHQGKIVSKQNANGGGWFKQNVNESGWQFSMRVKEQKCGCHPANAGDLEYLQCGGKWHWSQVSYKTLDEKYIYRKVFFWY